MKYILGLLITIVTITASAQQLPKFTVVKYDTAAVKGYFFLTANDNLIIMDKDGSIVYYKPLKAVLDFIIEKNGKMVFATTKNSYIMDSTFKVINTFACKNNILHDQHDRIFLPDGNILMMGKEFVTVDLTNKPEWLRVSKSKSLGIPAVIIQEQDTLNKIIFDWHGKNYFTLNDVDSFFISRDNSPEWTHSNAMELDADGNILLSSRNLNEITKINRNDGSIMWRWGGKQNEFKFINCPVPFYGQHNIRRLENGNYTLFDNGDNIIPHPARALEFHLDEKNKTATLVWSYVYDKKMSSKGRGNVQRLSNGNTLINFGAPSYGDISFVIVNSKGEKKMKVSYPSSKTYRVLNYSSLPFKLNRPIISAVDSAGAVYLDAGAGYSSYIWNTEETTQKIKVTHPGDYSVFVPYGEGGFISAEKFKVNQLLKPEDTKPMMEENKK